MPKQGGSNKSASFVDHIVTDPSNPPDTLLLQGYLGASSEEGHVRLYLDPQLSDYVEIPQDAVLHSVDIPPEESPLGGSYVWINRDAELTHGKVGADRPKAKFLEGRIQQQFQGGTGGQAIVTVTPCSGIQTQCCISAPPCSGVHTQCCISSPPCSGVQTQCCPQADALAAAVPISRMPCSGVHTQCCITQPVGHCSGVHTQCCQILTQPPNCSGIHTACCPPTAQQPCSGIRTACCPPTAQVNCSGVYTQCCPPTAQQPCSGIYTACCPPTAQQPCSGIQTACCPM